MKYYSLGGVEMVTNVLASRFLDNGCRVSIVSFIEPSNEILCRKDSRIIYYLLSGFNTSKKNIDQLRNILIEEKIDIVINQWGLPYVPIYVLKKASKGLSLKIFSVHHNSPKTNGRLKDIEIAIPLDAPAPASPIKCSEPMLDAKIEAPIASHVASRPPKK